MIHDGSHKFELHSFNEKQADRLNHCLPCFGQAQKLPTALWTLSSSAKKSLPTFFECAVARRFQQAFLGLPELFRKLRNLSQLLSTNLPITTTRSLSLAKNHRKPANAMDDSFKRIRFFFLLRPFGTNRYIYCGRSCEGERDRATQQYLIEPGHCMRADFTCKSRRCRGELWEMVFPWSLIDSRNYFHQPN